MCMRHGRKCCPCVSGGGCAVVQPGQVLLWSGSGGFCGSAPGEMLARKGLPKKHFSAFLTLITCFPDTGLAPVLEGADFSRALAGCHGTACAMDVSGAYPGHAVHEGHCSIGGSAAPSPRCSDLGPLIKSPACLLPTPSPGGMKQSLARPCTPVR